MIILNRNRVPIEPKHTFGLEQDKILQSELGSDCSRTYIQVGRDRIKQSEPCPDFYFFREIIV